MHNSDASSATTYSSSINDVVNTKESLQTLRAQSIATDIAAGRVKSCQYCTSELGAVLHLLICIAAMRIQY